MSKGFDRIAPYYDFLARLIFGGSIRRSQIVFLNKIPAGANILILGGGTGWVLAELFKVNPTCRVWYIEESARMLEKAKALISELPSRQIVFLHGTERDLLQLSEQPFDAVITNFYFDLFTSTTLERVIENIKISIRPGTRLLVSDFVEESQWQQLLLFVMYRFFRWTCAIEASRLPEWQKELKKQGFTELDMNSFYFGFIKSSLYVFD